MDIGFFPLLIIVLVLVGLFAKSVSEGGENRHSVGRVLGGLMLAGVMVVSTLVALRIFRVPLERALETFVAGASIPSHMGGALKILVPLLLVFVPLAFLLSFVFDKKESQRPVVPTVVKEPSRAPGGRMLVVGALLGFFVAIGVAAFSVLMWSGGRIEVASEEQPATVYEELTPDHAARIMLPPTPPRPPVPPQSLGEPLALLDDEAKAPPAAVAEPEEASTPDGAKADEKPHESVDEQPSPEPPRKDQTSATLAESPSGEAPPSWVGRDGFREGNVYKTAVTLDPGPTQQLCEEELLLPAVREKIKAYAGAKLGPEAARRVRLPDEYIRNQMIGDDLWVQPVKVESFSELDHKLGREIWGEAANASTDHWVRLHALVKFDADVDSRIKQQWIAALRFQRLQGVGGIVVIVLLALAGLYAYLRFDLATGGVYRNRLRVAALTAIMLIILGVFLTKS